MTTGVFSTYSTGENRVTASILAVLRSLSLERTDRVLGALLQDSEFNLVRFEDQPARGGRGVPDAGIFASCRVLIETKIKRNAVDQVQLKHHRERLDNAGESTRVLLVLTPDGDEPKAVTDLKDDRVVWASFEQLTEAIEDLLSDAREVISEREAFLLRELQAMFEQEGLTGEAADTVVVPARWAWPKYKRLRAYICQPGRSFLPAKYIAFYTANRIQVHVPLIEECHDQIELEIGKYSGRLGEIVSAVLKERPQDRGQRRKVFLLTSPDDQRTIQLDSPIENDLKSRNGRRVAFTQNQRYVHSDELVKARTTSALVED